MRENYPLILKWAGLSEGGYINHPSDPGGATDRGITQRTFDAWNRRHGLPKRSVRGISKVEYLDAVRADELPSGVDYAVADYSINSGPSQAVKDLQRVVGVKADGQIGPQTMAAVDAMDAAKIVVELCQRRLAFMKRLKHWPMFETGWKIRVMGKRDGVQTDDIGVIDRGVKLARGAKNIPEPSPVGQAKAAPDEITVTASIKDAITDKGAAGTIGGITAGVGALSQLEGPLAWAVAAVVVIGAVAGVVWLLRRQKT
jgi:lysozyme family protein